MGAMGGSVDGFWHRWGWRGDPTTRLRVWHAVALWAIAGAAIGLGALACDPVRNHLGLAAILWPGSWWAMPLSALPDTALAAIGTMLTTPVGGLPGFAGPPAGLAIAALVLGTAILLRRPVCQRWCRLPPPAAALLAGICVALAIALLGLTAIWLAAALNFWLFAVLTVAWQFYRHGHL